MKVTMELDMQLVYNIANTLGLIADGLMDGHLTPSSSRSMHSWKASRRLLILR